MTDPLTEQIMTVNMGPSHPAMHGTIKCKLWLEGEKIKNIDVEPGFLHRGFEKETEQCTWTQVFPYTDRLNYVSPLLNNIGYALAVEKLLGIDITLRAKFIRVILGEISRIADHLICNSAVAMELGAFTPFLYLIKAREMIFKILEKLTGARVTHSFIRIGGLKEDLYEDFSKDVLKILPEIEKVIDDVEKLLVKNRIFLDRMTDTGKISQQDAISYGLTGPVLRSTGIDYDVRKANPYLIYNNFDFSIPVGTSGDNYDRFIIRFEEIRQSMKIINQALNKLPQGPVNVEDLGITLPDKIEVYTTIEGTIAHFSNIINGIRVPQGEVYSYTEAANGELGFYIVSTGDRGPYRCHLRAPCFANLQSLNKMVEGRYLADIIPSFGSLNMIGGECDR